MYQRRLVSGLQDAVADGETINITVNGFHFVSLSMRDQAFASQSDDLKTRWETRSIKAHKSSRYCKLFCIPLKWYLLAEMPIEIWPDEVTRHNVIGISVYGRHQSRKIKTRSAPRPHFCWLRRGSPPKRISCSRRGLCDAMRCITLSEQDYKNIWLSSVLPKDNSKCVCSHLCFVGGCWTYACLFERVSVQERPVCLHTHMWSWTGPLLLCPRGSWD